MSLNVDANTQVSAPGMPISQGTASASAAPGATGPGANISMTKAVFTTLGVAAGGLVALGILFRKKGGGGLPPLRVDAANAVNVYFSWLLINGTLKLIAYKYHGHNLAQEYLLIA
jgi:hypothetical protein